MKTGTIFAPATAIGRAGIAVIRVSGDRAGRVFEALCVDGSAASPSAHPSARRANRRSIRNPITGEALDEALVIWFPAPNSFTGEDVVELHLHGGRSVVDGVLDVLGGLDGYRLAEPGEFTRRAFENGKMDLTEAEGLADLIDAETSAQRRQALRQMGGALGEIYEDWRNRLIKVLAYFEASIDFSEEDIPDDLMEQTHRDSLNLLAEVEKHLLDSGRGERLRDGIHIAILGAPNAGKSSLLNILVRREAAIVSETAGTTRDIIEVRLDLDGYPVVIADTAGIRESEDAIEQEGVRRALGRAEDVDLKIVLLEGEGQEAAVGGLVDENSLLLVNKIDLYPLDVPVTINDVDAFGISAKTGEGIDGFLNSLGEMVQARFAMTESVVLTRARHREALNDCIVALKRAWASGPPWREPELIAEDLRLAVRALGSITGRVDVEDLLDKIFSDFCIGK
jgi:tRNA modification GTPase